MQVLDQRRQPDDELQRSDLEFRRLLEKLPAAAYTCDPAGLITYFNRRAAELWGREPRLNHAEDRFCGSFKLFSPDGSPIVHERCWMALALQDQQEYNGHEIVIERPNGSRRAALAHANPIHNGSGGLVGAVNVLVDITDRKRAEDSLRKADRNKNEFLAILAHELRNPLAPLRNSLQLLKLTKDPQAFEQVRGMMERQVDHVVRLVDDLLDVSRITRNKLELRKQRVELASMIYQAVETCRPLLDRTQLELTVTVPTQAVYLNADPVRFVQVLSNLLNNACKFTESGGHIWLTAERQGGEAVVSVKDTGVGIPPDMLLRVFEMFTQIDQSVERTSGGLGIGLTLVQRLVEQHEGSIEARSEGLGRGSEFIVRLPLLPDTLGPPEPQEPQVSSAGDGQATAARRILVVDDNEDSVRSLALLLRLAGNEVHTAHDGQEAVDVAEKVRPDVVLLDIGMPKLNGYDACRRIREQPWGRSMVLIALTGWGQEENRRSTKAAGFDAHLVKPVEYAALVKLLDEARPARV